MKDSLRINQITKLGIPVFLTAGFAGCGKTYFSVMILEDLAKRGKRVLYINPNINTISSVKAKIKESNAELIIFDENEEIFRDVSKLRAQNKSLKRIVKNSIRSNK